MTNKSDVEIFVDSDEKHIQINDLDISDIEKVWEQLLVSYPGFVADFCFTNTLASEKFLLGMGAQVLENSMIMRLAEKDFVEMATASHVELVTKANFDSFAAYHDSTNPEMYWSSARLLADFDSWDIFTVQRNSEIAGYALLRDSRELYCVIADSVEDKIALASAAARKNFAAKADDLTFWVDRDNFTERGAASHLGFRHEGYRISYRVEVAP